MAETVEYDYDPRIEDAKQFLRFAADADTSIEGGHCVVLAGFDDDGATVISWGALYKMTWAFFSRYVDEAYGLISALWIEKTGATPANAPSRSGFPLGIEPDVKYAQTVTPLPPGAAALLYTDGLSETRNAAGEMLGEKMLFQLLAQAAAHTCDAHAGKHFLLGRLADFCDHAPPTDDQTLIFIRHLA